MVKISVVSPMYNEGPGVVKFINAVTGVLKDINHEIILVDDGSKDNTWEVIQKESSKNNKIKGVKLSKNFGKESALIAGLSHATGNACITIDSDLQHPVEIMPEMISLWQDNKYEVVECVKEKRQSESFINKVNALLFYKIFSRLSGFDLSGATDYKLMDKKVVNTIISMPEKSIFFRGISAWVGYKRIALFFTPGDRTTGTSKWPFIKKLNLAVNSLSAFSAKPLAAIWALCLLFAVFSVFVGIEAIYNYITGKAASGFTTIILLILILGTCLLFAISLLSVYIAQIFHEVKNRPKYIIEQTVNKDD